MPLSSSQYANYLGGNSSASSAYNYQQQKKDKIFSGGLFSDVLDALSVPMYAVGGVLSGEGASAGIKNRTDPGEAFGIKNPWIRFAVDIALDPLTYVGFGELTSLGKTAAKTKTVAGMVADGTKGFRSVEELKTAYRTGEELATTYGGQAARGQRSLLTFGIGDFSIPLVPQKVSEMALGGATRGVEAIKRFGSKWGVDLGSTSSKILGIRPTLAVSKGADIAELEARASLVEGGRLVAKKSNIVSKGAKALEEERIAVTQKNFKAAVKKGGLDMAEASKALLRKLEDGATQIPKALDNIYNEMKGLSDELGVRWGNAGGSVLEGKVLPKVAEKAARLETAGFAAKAGRMFGGRTPSDVMDKLTLLKNSAGDAIGGYAATPSKIRLENGLDLIDTGGGKYILKKVYDAVKAGKESLPKQIANLEKAIAKAGEGKTVAGLKKAQEQLDMLKHVQGVLDLDNLAANAPEVFYTRAAAGIEKSEELAQKFLGRELTYEKNPFTLMAVKASRVARKEGIQKFVEGMKAFGNKVAKGGVIPEGYARSTLKDLKGYVFPKEIISHMDEVYTSFAGLKEVGKALETLDEFQNFWKGSATFSNLAFHTRNFISNFWQLHLAGAYNLKRYGEAAEVMWAKRFSASKAGKTILDTLEGESKIRYTEFVSQGLGGTGAFTGDMGGITAKISDNFLFNTGKKLGASIEDFAKYALYLDRRAKGFGVREAADEVRKYLFDYSDLTDFEKTWAKRAFPFYAWTRKNIPLQLSMLIQKPGKINDLRSFQDAISANAEGEPMDEKYLPGWLQEAYPVYFGTGKDGMQNFIKLEGFIPAVDLNKLSRPNELLTESISPLIKTPMELITNYSVYQEKNISDFDGQRKKFLNVYLPSKVEYVLSQIRPLAELNKALGTGDQAKIGSAKERFWAAIIGKIYSYDLATQKRYFDYVQSYQEAVIKKDIEKARNAGSTDEVERLFNALKEVQLGNGVHL